MRIMRTSIRRRRVGTAAAACGALVAGTVAVVAANPALAEPCEAVEYHITNEWGNGHDAAVAVTAAGEDIDGWTIEFDLPDGARAQNAWNVEWSQSGSAFTGSDVGSNARIPSGRTGELFGLTVTGTAGDPTGFTVNGRECGGETVLPDGASAADEPDGEPDGETRQEKQTRVPQFLVDAGAETGNFVESENFTVRWGDAVDVVEWGDRQGYDDYPRWVADHMEEIWDFYVDEVGWVDPARHDPGADYRINLYLCGSWSGDLLPPANWAGPDDIGVGHMCLPYDKTWDDWVESHEFNHILQSYASDINAANGNGGGWGHGNPVAGPVWEAHANFMARMKRPDVVAGSGYYADRQRFRWLAQETYYGDWMLFNTIRDTYGQEYIDRFWYEAEQGEHPVETIKRVLGLDHDRFAALIGDCASRQVVYDFSDGEAVRGDLWGGGPYSPLHTDEVLDQGGDRYRIADDDAPHQYGHNMIRLDPSDGRVSVGLQGRSDLSGADWRFRLAAVSADFSVRYSDVYAPGETADFSLESGETHMMLVVAATPSEHRDYPMWEVGVGDPFPYELTITGAAPV